MLYPIDTATRVNLDLNGIWKFKLERTTTKPIDVSKPLDTSLTMAVPGSYNDQAMDDEIRSHVGNVWYERTFIVPNILTDERIVLRFGSVTHEATVYLNGKEIVNHKGGFLPFEVQINDDLVEGENRLTIRVNNILDYSTLPVGVYTEETDPETGQLIRRNRPNFDFFNYAGIHRPVKIYTTPKAYIEDIVFTYDLEDGRAVIKPHVSTQGEFDQIRVTAIDEEGTEVAQASGEHASLIIENYTPWQPLNAYLYTMRVEAFINGELIDSYDEPLGLRTVEVKDGQFLINGEPFYFKGYGKHEDTNIHGRGLNETMNKADLNLFKWMGANSFRTSHYPYSEEMMRLADQEGIVVIDEVPAVGLFEGFGFDSLQNEGVGINTWNVMDTKEAHEQALRELVARDKNHACVVMWSVANEAATHDKGAYEYFKPLVDLVNEIDPQGRPSTIVYIQFSQPDTDLVAELVDVISLNRYYGWYFDMMDFQKAKRDLKAELEGWQKKYPDKPVLFTEYGVDTIAGFHSTNRRAFTEEFQVEYYDAYHEVFDSMSNVVGEQVWNFADFETSEGIQRVKGNKKGIFTREREPKMIAFELKKRWKNIPDFGYKTK